MVKHICSWCTVPWHGQVNNLKISCSQTPKIWVLDRYRLKRINAYSKYSTRLGPPFAYHAISENAYRPMRDLALCLSILRTYAKGNRIQNERLNALLGSRANLRSGSGMGQSKIDQRRLPRRANVRFAGCPSGSSRLSVPTPRNQ